MDGGIPGATEFAGRVTSGSGSTLSVAPPGEVAHAMIEELYGEYGDEETMAGENSAAEPVVRLLYPDDRVDELFAEFGRATQAAELIERGVLAIRTIDQVSQRLTVTEETAFAHLQTGGEVRSLGADRAAFTGSIRDTYQRQWEASRPAQVPAPSRSRFVRTFRESFPEAADTLAAVLATEEIGQRDELDPVTATTLVAARHEIQTIELSEWAESIGFSSRTELSRVTNRLTDRGLIATDRVPHGVGRPRQRLTIAVNDLEATPPTEFLGVARALYHEGVESPSAVE